jgi:asparagine synthetase B (glutamine-hydrolysing)
MIVPKLGSTIGRRWLARSARAMPSWIRPSFFRSPALEQAREQRGEWASHGRTNEMLAALLHVAPTAGSRAGMRLLYASHAVELGSPMLDRRIVELAMALPSRLRAGASTKTFLRRAADERLPREVTDRPKDAGFYAAFQRRGLCHPRVDVALSRAGALSWSSEMIDVAALENRLRAIRAGSALSSSEAEQLCSVVSTISWTTRLAEQYAVSP